MLFEYECETKWSVRMFFEFECETKWNFVRQSGILYVFENLSVRQSGIL